MKILYKIMTDIQEAQTNIINLLKESGLYSPINVVTSFSPRVRRNWFGRNKGYTISAPDDGKILLRENSADLCYVNTNPDFAERNFERNDFDTLVQVVNHYGSCRGSLIFREGQIEECHVHDHMSDNYPWETDLGTWVSYMLIDRTTTFPVFRTLMDSVPKPFRKRIELLTNYGIDDKSIERDFALYQAMNLSEISDLEKASQRFGITPSESYHERVREGERVKKIVKESF